MSTKPARNSYFYLFYLPTRRPIFPHPMIFGMMGDNAKGDVKTFVDKHKTAPNHFFNLFHHSMGNIEWGKISRLFRLKRRLIFPHPLNWLLLFETAI